MKVCLITNIPAPYRVPVFNALGALPGIDLRVLYCARTHSHREWDLPPLSHDHEFLAGHAFRRKGRFIHANPSVWPALRRQRPEVVVTGDFNPTSLLAWAFARTHGATHVATTDGTDISEADLGAAHRLARRSVYRTSRAFIVASEGGRRLLKQYGVDARRIHRAPLIANPAVPWREAETSTRPVDLLCSGRLAPVKNVGFALEVAAEVGTRLGRKVKLAVLGDGPRREQLQRSAAAVADRVDATFAGHVAQADLPQWYARSRLFLFPTLWDPWGVVANEACEVGTPVLISPHAGAAGDLVVDGLNGRVLDLDVGAWADAATELLREPALWQRMSEAAQQRVGDYGLPAAVTGMADAIFDAAGRRPVPEAPESA